MPKKVQIKRVLVDVDDVLVDFVRAACALHGHHDDRFDQLQEGRTTWDICEPLGISQTDFWRPINAMGATFWEGLDDMPWASDLMTLVRTYWPNEWGLATAPSWGVHAYTGKVNWIKQKFGSRFDRFFISPHKEWLAKPGVLLIDDRAANVEKFTEAGGTGLLFPGAGNELRGYRYNPMEYVEPQLRRFAMGI